MERSARLDWMTHRCDMDIEAGEEKVERLRHRLGEDPVDALNWADQVFDATAKAQVATVVKGMVANKGFDYARARANEKALDAGRWPSRSTSPASNLMAQALATAWAAYAVEMNEAAERDAE